jgi:AraC family ethanolamine operon transcriptional activator
MQHLSFSEFEAYTEALGDVEARLMLVRQDQPKWELDSLMAGRLHVQKGQTGSPVIAEAAANAGGQLLWVSVAGRHTVNGQPNNGRMVLVVPGGADFTIAVHGANEWLAVFVPQEFLGTNDDATGCNLSWSRVERPGEEQVARLRIVLAAVVRSAEIEPSILTAPAAQVAIQSDVLAACRTVVGSSPTTAVSGRPLISRAQVIRTAKELIERCDDEVLHIDELAQAADVSPRTLQTVFLDYYGIPPLRYLTLRRLHKVRDALRNADPDEMTVTSIAAQFGFWQFGRFAGQYRRLFGELPSATLSGKKWNGGSGSKKSSICMGPWAKSNQPTHSSQDGSNLLPSMSCGPK